MIIKHVHLTGITVTPKISKSDIEKLRPDWKHPKQGVEFKRGKHTIVVKISKGTKKSKPNRITAVGIKVVSVNPSDKLSKYFKSVTIVISKRKFTRDGKRKTVKKTIKVPLKTIVDDLKNILRKPHHYVKTVTIKFEVEKVVKVKLNVKGCVDKVSPPPTVRTTTRVPGTRPPHTTTKPKTTMTLNPSSSSISTSIHFPVPDLLKPCIKENIVRNPNFTEFRFTPNITKCEEKKLRYGSSKPGIGVHLICGTHSISVVVKDHEFYLTSNLISNVGFFILNSSNIETLDKYFEYLDVVISRHPIPRFNIEPISTISVINVPLTYVVRDLYNIIPEVQQNIESIRFVFKLKVNIVVKLFMKGCVKAFVSSTPAPLITPQINDESFKCVKLFNLLKRPSLFVITSYPKFTDAEKDNLRISSNGVLLMKGYYKFEFSLPEGQNLNIVELGTFIFVENKEESVDDFVEFIEVFVTRLSKSFGRVIATRRQIVIPDALTVKNSRNILSTALTSINKISLKFIVKKNVKASFNIKGCKRMDSVIMSTLSSTLSSTFGPLINEQTFRCTNLNNLLENVNSIAVKVLPNLPNSEIDKLRSLGNYPVKGALLNKGFYTMEFSLPSSQSLNIVEIGMVLFDENEERYINSMIKIVKVIVSRLSKSFGKIISRNMPISIPENMTVRDLKNLLSSGLTNINKILLKFYLKKHLRAIINIRGCKDSDTVLISPTTIPTPLINDETYRCSVVRNLLHDIKIIQVNVVPTISTTETNKLRAMGNYHINGASLSKGKYTVEIKLGTGQNLNIIEIGVIILKVNQNELMKNIIKTMDITVTRLSKSFGKFIETNRPLNIPDNLSIRDLKNILTSGLTNINKVVIQFQLIKAVKTQINLKGCYSFDSATTLLTTTLTPLINDESYNCANNVNLLSYPKVIKLSKIPPLSPIDNSKLRFTSLHPNVGAPIIRGKQEISITLPSGEKGTIVELGLNILGENNNTIAEKFVRNMAITAYRLRLSFGVLTSSPMKINLPLKMTIGKLKNVLTNQIMNVNKILITFETVRKVNLNILMNGCFSPTILKTTTLPPVGCLHLNKYYHHGQVIADKFECDSKICSDGRTIPIIICSKKWTQWQKCSKFCGAGETSRRQICLLNPLMRSIDKQTLIKKINETCLNKVEVKPCFEQPCQESCKLTQWSDWSPCNNNTCKDEHQTRLRQLISTNKNTLCTKPLMESRRCIKTQCPCAENAVLHGCANILCPTSCDHMNQRVRCVSDNKECVKACICKFGYLYQNGKCVRRSQCLCLKPDFNNLMLLTTLSVPDNQGSGQTSPRGTAENNSRSIGGLSSSTPNINSITTTKFSNIPLNELSKNDLKNLRKKKQITPPWAPGYTNAPLYQASPPWFAGTTPAGATIKLPMDSTTQITIKTPPSGLTAIPPDSLSKTSTTLKYFVTQRYVLPPSNQNSNQNQNSASTTNKQQVNVVSSDSLSSISSSNPNAPSSQSPQSLIPDNSGSIQLSTNSVSSRTVTQFPTFSTSTNIKNRINANSTVIVDCQSCICTNGRLVCSGPHCFVGTNTWSDWSTWSPCTGVCGIGIRRRFRQCQGTNCKDNSTPKSGMTRFMATNGIQAEDKQCMIKECSCIFSRELLKIHIGDDVINKFNIDLAAVWIEKDNIKGLTHNKEIVKPGEIIKSGLIVHAKCSQCICKNGQFNCNVECS